MKSEERKQRFALTFIVTSLIFLVLLVSSVIAGVIGGILVSNGVITVTDGAFPGSGHLILLMAASSLVVGVVLTFFFSKIPLKPMNRLIDSMNRLATGDYAVRISFGRPYGNTSVMKEISDSFNTMAEELQNTEMLRSDFINNFSHEFKTPIVSIAGFTKLLKRGNLSEVQMKEYIDIIEEESLRLAQMATNVLNLTKVENQTILTNVSTFNLSEQIRSCLLLLENKWAKKNLEFELEFGEYMVCANEELLKHVWINLLDNAIKFSEDAGVVAVRIAEEKDDISVCVANTGSEIKPESLNKIFNKFYQADESHSSEGNGVGLSVVKRVVELHNGRVGVQSGNGVTTFKVQLPRVR